MAEGERILALTLNANQSVNGVNNGGEDGLAAIYSEVNAGVQLRLINGGRTLALDCNGINNNSNNSITIQLEEALMPGLCCCFHPPSNDSNGDADSITILGASVGSATVYRILVQAPYSEDNAQIHAQTLPSQYSARKPVACHGLNNGVAGQDSGSNATPALIVAYADGSLAKFEWSEQEGVLDSLEKGALTILNQCG